MTSAAGTEAGDAVDDATENHPDGSSAVETSNWTLFAGAGAADGGGRRKADAAELASSCADSAYSTRSSDDVDDEPMLLLSEDEPNDQVLC